MIFGARERFFKEIARAANQWLTFNPDLRARLISVGDIEIACEGLGVNIVLADGRIALNSFDHTLAGAHIQGRALDIIRYFFDSNTDAEEIRQRLVISGDTEAVYILVNLSREQPVDWEELASRLFGDTGTYMLGRFTRGIRGWANETRDLIAERLGEYIAYEAHVVITRSELSAYAADVTALEAQVDELACRIERLVPSVHSTNSFSSQL